MIGQAARSPSDDTRSFEWDFALGTDDYRAMVGAYGRRQKQQRKPVSRAMLFLLWLALVAAVVFLMQVGTLTLQPWLIGFIVGALAMWLAIWLYYQLVYPRTAGKRNALEGKTIKTTIDATGVLSSTDTTSSRFAWAAIEWVDETGEHYFLWPSSLVVLVIPKRALSGADEEQRFTDALKDWTGGK